jgi:nucleoside-diphosphate-sugar epimerase
MPLYLVTGATGFIGKALCHSLQSSGHRVRALLHHNAPGPWHESYTADLGNEPLPASLMDQVDGIFHCAGAAHFSGLSSAGRNALWQLNVTATEQLIGAAAVAGMPRLVYFSSVQAAGSPGEQPVDEDWQCPPDNLYGESKLAAEALLQQASGNGIPHVVILRPCLVYGPGVKGNLRRMLEAIDRGRMPALPDAHQQRSMVGLGSLVEAARLAMECSSAGGRLYIVCDDHDYSTRALYDAMHQALGRAVPGYRLPLGLFRWAARLGDLGNRLGGAAMPWDSAAYQRLFGNARYNAARIKRELGWQPRQDFYSCLPEIVAEMRSRQRPGHGR